jgi:hypothetical protein
MLAALPLLCLGLAQADPPPAAAKAPVGPPLPTPAVRHALILCGHPGDAEHTKAFADTVRKLRDGLTKTLGIPADRQRVVFGADAPKDLPGATGPATRETITAAVAEFKKGVRTEDGVWVICLGHCHHDGRHAWWNLPGPDLTAADFGRLFLDLACREQVFVMTTSLSGYFVAPLSKKERVVIAATEADAETNETTFPAVFAQFLADGLKPAEHDADGDGRLTVFDLYVAVAKEIAQSYASAEQVATEHPQLDDDGDGVGHEPQNPYLPEALGGPPPGKKPGRRPQRDGLLVARMLLTPGK